MNRVTYTTSLDPEIKRRFKMLCVKSSKNQNEVLERIILDYLESEEKKEQLANKEGEGVGNTDH